MNPFLLFAHEEIELLEPDNHLLSEYIERENDGTHPHAVYLNKEQIKALSSGKILAFRVGEYLLFLKTSS